MATVNGQTPHGVATCLLFPEACGQTQEGSLVHKHLRAVPGPRWSLCFLPPGELSAGLTPEEPSLSESAQSGLSRRHTAAKASFTASEGREQGSSRLLFLDEVVGPA